MNEKDKWELQNLKVQLLHLQSQLREATTRLEELEKRAKQAPEPIAPQTSPQLVHSASQILAARPKPPPLPPEPLRTLEEDTPAPAHTPLNIARKEAQAPAAEEPKTESTRVAETIAAPPPPSPLGPEPTPEPAEEPSFEMHMGRYWFVRIGVVMLLTSLAFFGSYAYQHFIVKMGPPGKVAFLYLISGLLLGVGAWLQRKQESLRNYAQVLFSGGLAAVYFTTYAAHYFQNLRVIASPLLAGTLLMGWAGFMVWLADRKKSELMALFAVGLAYYASIINRAELFTLFSNLVLTAAAVVFLVRNRWAMLSFASLVATYAGYAYWRFFHDGQFIWRWDLSAGDFWIGTLFLLGYWVLFTVAVFLSEDVNLRDGNRSAFLTFNNAAFFGLVALTVPMVYPDSFWVLPASFGAVLLGLALLAKQQLPDEAAAANSYLTQGLIMVTWGVIAYFTGAKLAFALAAETVVLVYLGEQRNNNILRVGSYIAAALAVMLGLDDIKRFDRAGLIVGTSVGALQLFSAWFLNRREAAEKLRGATAYFSVLALFMWFFTTLRNVEPANLAPVLAVEALVLSFSWYALRLREVTFLAQGYLVLAQLAWAIHALSNAPQVPWWNPMTIIAVTLALSHWWQRQQQLACEPGTRQFLQGVYGLALAGVLYTWIEPQVSGATWLWLSALLGIGVTGYGLATRAWFLAGIGQLFTWVSVLQYVYLLARETPGKWIALVPIVVTLGTGLAALAWINNATERGGKAGEMLTPLTVIYRLAAGLMGLMWIFEYVPAEDRAWALMFVGLLLFLWSNGRQETVRLCASAGYTLIGLFLVGIDLLRGEGLYAPNLIAILLFLGQQQLARRMDRYFALPGELQSAMIVIGLTTLWLYLSKWVTSGQSGFYLTVAWAVYALVLFGLGLGLRETAYRRMGLTVLAFAIGRVGLIDVWKLETLHRILSFMALGIVLLVLGFVYNKYQEKLRQWL
ncbi:MAG: DUF2339 domain-containing protein [Verrucomicrobiota bacterium]